MGRIYIKAWVLSGCRHVLVIEGANAHAATVQVYRVPHQALVQAELAHPAPQASHWLYNQYMIVTGLYVAPLYRRQGYAKALLTEVNHMADRYQWTLRIYPEQQQDDVDSLHPPMTTEQLRAFYQRMGYTGTDGLIRLPQSDVQYPR